MFVDSVVFRVANCIGGLVILSHPMVYYITELILVTFQPHILQAYGGQSSSFAFIGLEELQNCLIGCVTSRV